MPVVVNRLRAALATASVSQTELAHAAGVPYSTLRNMVRTGGDALLGHALAIGEVLQVEVEELFRLTTGE